MIILLGKGLIEGKSVKKGTAAWTLDRWSWGPNFGIGFDFKITKNFPPNQVHNLFHLTATGRDCDSPSTCWKGKFQKGDRIPAIFFIDKGKEGIWMHVTLTNRGNEQDSFDQKIQIHQWYKVQLEQKDKKFIITIDGNEERIFETESTVFHNVTWYQSDPWYNSIGDNIELKNLGIDMNSLAILKT